MMQPFMNGKSWMHLSYKEGNTPERPALNLRIFRPCWLLYAIASSFIFFWSLLFSVQSSAMAQDRVCEAFTLSEYRGLMDVSRNALSGGQFHRAHKAATRVYTELRCLDERVSPADMSLFAELSATLALMDQDEELARRWTQLRHFLSRETEWQVQGPPAFHEYFNAISMPEIGTASGAGIRHPKGYVVVMNGRVLSSLDAPIEVPVFIQLVGRKEEVLRAWWQDGMGFAEELVASNGKESKIPSWSKKFIDSDMKHTQHPDTIQVVAAPKVNREKGWLSTADPKTWMPDCKWAGVPVVAKLIRDEVIGINDNTYDLTRTSGEMQLNADLNACHEFIAQRRLAKWRNEVKSAQRIGRISQTDFDSVMRALKQATHELSAEVHRRRFLNAMNEPR